MRIHICVCVYICIAWLNRNYTIALFRARRRLEMGSYLCKVDSSCDSLCCKSSARTTPLPVPRTPYSYCLWDRCIVPRPRLPPANRTADRSLPSCRLKDLPHDTYTCRVCMCALVSEIAIDLNVSVIRTSRNSHSRPMYHRA